MRPLPLYPLPFEPFLRPMPWGGRRLANWLTMPLPADQSIGEAWLLSDHALHASRVAAGPLAGWTIRQLMAERSEELLGYKTDRFPLLIKLLDARENLSVQVHPDDAEAAKWAPGEGGKTEAWLVLESDSEAIIYLGLKPGFDKRVLMRELARGTAPLCLQRYEPRPGQCYFVPAGTIHALGGGVVVLEVQQTSDATFRLYDWGRVDAAGQPRPLHLEAGLACLRERPTGAGLQKSAEPLVACAFFRWHQLQLREPRLLRGPAILVGLGGQARLADVAVQRGATVLLPACLGAIELVPETECHLAYIALPTS